MTNRNAHYRRLGMEPHVAIRHWKKSWGAHSFECGSIVKYVARMFEKDTPRKNLDKIQYYVNELRRELPFDRRRRRHRKKVTKPKQATVKGKGKS